METIRQVTSTFCARLALRLGAAAVPALLVLASCAPPAVVTAPPPPADVTNCRDCHAGTGSYPLAADVYKFWETSGHGRYAQKPQKPTCESCHDLKNAAAGHLDGKKNAPGPNPFHLVAGFIAQAPKNEWDFQVQFDEYCWTACHQPAGISDMRHERDGVPAKGAVQMGTHASYERPLKNYLVDGDLGVFAGAGAAPFFIPCVGCHDPHGSGATSTTGGSNRMAVENYKEPAQMCSRCHI